MTEENVSRQQTKGLLRNTIDKFYTKRDVVNFCKEMINKNIIIHDDDLVIEPSAGNGSFIDAIRGISKNYRFFDIAPEDNLIEQMDYLNFAHEKTISKYKKIHIIGNPPFGRQSSMAIKFIKKSCAFCNTVSFILPKSFKKASMQKYFPLNFHLKYQGDLPKNAFLMNNKEYDVPCVFQIWIKKETLRPKVEILQPINFTFVKKDDNPTISFRRVGVNAGTISQNIGDKSEQSHYFIKFSDEMPCNIIIKKLQKVEFDCNNTVGPKSISKQEIIGKYNQIFISINQH